MGGSGFVILLLVILVIVWKPKNAGIYPMKHWKPKYRSLGAPPPLPNYILFDDDHWSHDDFKKQQSAISNAVRHTEPESVVGELRRWNITLS